MEECVKFFVLYQNKKKNSKRPKMTIIKKDKIEIHTNNCPTRCTYKKALIVWRSWHVLHKKGRVCIHCIIYKEGLTVHNTQESRQHRFHNKCALFSPLLFFLVHALLCVFLFMIILLLHKKIKKKGRKKHPSLYQVTFWWRLCDQQINRQISLKIYDTILLAMKYFEISENNPNIFAL